MTEIKIKSVESLTVFCLEGIPLQVGQLINQLMTWSQKQRASPASAPLVLFHALPGDMPIEQIRCEACVALTLPEGTASLTPETPIYSQTLPEIKAATVFYEGPQSPQQEMAIVAKLMNWIREQGHKRTGPVRQLYHRVWLVEGAPHTKMETQIPL